MKKIITLLAAIITFVSMSMAVRAADNMAPVNMTVEIPQLMVLKWDMGEDGSVIDLTGANAITAADLAQGFKTIQGGTLMVTSNMMWQLTVSAASDNFAGGNGLKPTSDLLVDINNSGGYDFQLFGATPIDLLRYVAPTAQEFHAIDYKLFIDAQDAAGTYTTSLIFTLMSDGI